MMKNGSLRFHTSYIYLLVLGILPLVLLSTLTSCKSEPNQSESQENYLSSLSDTSFLKSILPFPAEETSNSPTLDAHEMYLKAGCQTINVYTELKKSSKSQKPLLIYFTGHGCMNCLRMENNVLENQKVKSLIQNQFHFIPLCTDERKKLPESHWMENPFTNELNLSKRPLKNIGGINSYFQVVILQGGSQPMFIALNENRKLGEFGFTKDTNEFVDFLKNAIDQNN